MQCGICLDDHDHVVQCPQCGFAACVPTLRRTLLESPHDAACPSCKLAWTDAFVAESFGRRWFLETYRQSRTRLLMERQKAMIPATMPAVDIERQLRRVKDQIAATEKLRNERIRASEDLKERMNHAENKAEYKRLAAERTLANAAWRANREIVKELKDIRDNLASRAERGDVQRGQPVAESFRCGTPECHGFVDAENPSCAVCDSVTCMRCLRLRVDTAHACDPRDVQSAATVRRTTRACPQCRTRIEKSFGCDQMFCVVCHTAFSYRTGERERGPIHNPHYMDLIRRTGRTNVPRDDACGCEPAIEEINRWDETARVAVLTAIRHVRHILDIDLRDLQHTDPDPLHKFRVKFVLGELSEEAFGRLVARNDFDRRVDGHYAAMLQAYVDATRGVLQRMTAATVREFLPELQRIAGIANAAAKSIGELYNRRYFVIDEFVEWRTVKRKAGE